MKERINWCGVVWYLIVLLCSPNWASGQAVKAPEKVEVPVGRLASITVQWEGDDFKYVTDLGLDVFREYDPDPKIVKLRCIGYTPGETMIHCIACKGGKLSEFGTCKVVVTGRAPDPTPDPVVPDPSDPLYHKLLSAYQAEKPDQQKYKTALSNFYKAASGFDLSGDLFTAKELQELLQRTATGLFPKGSMPIVQGIMTTELRHILPAEPTVVLTAEQKNNFKSLMSRAAKHLEAIK